MISRLDDGDVALSWRFVAAMIGVILTMLVGSWLVGKEVVSAAVQAATKAGASQNQIEFNTRRLDRIEQFERDVRDHDAKTTATFVEIERRLEQLEQRK